MAELKTVLGNGFVTECMLSISTNKTIKWGKKKFGNKILWKIEWSIFILIE